MSSRALRKLGKTSLEAELAKYQKTVDKDAINSDSDNNSKNDSDNEEQIIKKPINAFALLNASDESAESDESEESSSESEAEVVEAKINKPQSKPKKDKKTIDDLNDDELDKILAKVKIDDKKKKQQTVNENEDSYISDTASFDDDSENEEFLPPWPIYTPGGRLLTPKKLNGSTYLFSFDPKDLNPDREYENLFGKLSSAAINDADQTASSSISPEMLNQIKKLARNVRGWSGRDHRSIPGTTRKLKLTKIKDDWLPISKKPLSLDEMSKNNLLNLFTSKFKDDWKEILLEDINKEYKYGIRYYNMSQGPMFSIAATTEFFMSVVVQPDHESLIRLLQKFPYSIETILQVACILQRQGDNTNTNGLVERALFVFDWSLPNQLDLGNGKSRLPFEFFLNRQIYLTIFRNISVLTQKSIYYTAFTYCKLLFSFDPRDDPYGVRYFIDYYAFSSEEFQYLIDFVNSPFCQCYEEWLTAPLLYTVSLCYLKLGRKDDAKEALLMAYNKHPFVGHLILEKLGDFSHPWLLNDVTDTVKLISAIYINRLDLLLEEQSLKNFFLIELALIIEKIGKPNLEAYYWNNLETIPENIIRYVILSNESSVMAKIPESFWSDNEVYEFDVLPPKIGTTIYNYVDDNQISAGVMQNTMRSEEIRQLEDLLQQNIVER